MQSEGAGNNYGIGILIGSSVRPVSAPFPAKQRPTFFPPSDQTVPDEKWLLGPSAPRGAEKFPGAASTSRGLARIIVPRQ